MRRIAFLAGILVGAACAAGSGRFTKEKISRLHRGMSPRQIERMFGRPHRVKTFTVSEPGRQWLAMRYTYRVGPGPRDRNHFIFNLNYGPPGVLARWVINRAPP